MKLNGEPFDRIKDGEKTLEIRLYDEENKKIGIGDEIEFTRMPDFAEQIKVEVIGLLLYRDFSDLIDDLPASLMGYEESEKEYLKDSMYETYTKEEEEKFGVLGIKMKLINPEIDKKRVC